MWLPKYEYTTVHQKTTHLYFFCKKKIYIRDKYIIWNYLVMDIYKSICSVNIFENEEITVQRENDDTMAYCEESIQLGGTNS